MKTSTFIKSVVLGLALFTGAAQAANTYSFQFPTTSASVVASVNQLSPTEVGYFWSVNRGDRISQTFSSTGIFDVSGLELDLNVTRNALSTNAVIDWDVLVNGHDVGDWSWNRPLGTGLTHLSLSFGPIAGEFSSLALVVKNEVASGQGSIALGLNSAASVTAVPEPEAFAMLFAGLGVVGAFARRRSQKSLTA